MRIEQLTFTRFVAAIFIVIHHFGMTFYPFNTNPLLILVFQAPLFVSYFFALSGFVMIVAYYKKEHIAPLEYIQKRFARIYPVYLLATIALFAYILVTKDGGYNGIILNIFLLQAWIPGKATVFNAPGWSLSVELFFYLVFPLLFNYCYKRKYAKALAVATIVIWLLTQVLFIIVFRNPKTNFLACFPLMHINEFIAGNLAGLLFVWKLQHRKANYDWLILVLVVLLFLALKFHPPAIDYHNGILLILYIPIILAMALNTGRLTSLFNLKPFVFLGEISYSMYVLQVPVFFWCIVVIHSFHIRFSASGFFIYLAVLLLLSTISYLYVEIPLRDWINKLGRR